MIHFQYGGQNCVYGKGKCTEDVINHSLSLPAAGGSHLAKFREMLQFVETLSDKRES